MDNFHNGFENNSGGSVARERNYGGYILSDEAIKKGIARLSSTTKGIPSTISPVHEPIVEGGKVVGSLPFLAPTYNASFNLGNPDGGFLNTPDSGQYEAKSFSTIKQATGIGDPRPPAGGDFRSRVYIIDAHPADSYGPDGKTCLQTLCDEALTVLGSNPNWLAMNFYNPTDSFHSGLKVGSVAGSMLAWCWETHNTRMKISFTSPKPCVFSMTASAVRSMCELIFNENTNYVYPQSTDEVATLAAREEQQRRFVNGDFCNPDGAHGFTIGRDTMSNVTKYAVSLSQRVLQMPLPEHAKYWMSREELYYIPTFEETYSILLKHADTLEWAQFLAACGMRVPRLEETAKAVKAEELVQANLVRLKTKNVKQGMAQGQYGMQQGMPQQQYGMPQQQYSMPQQQTQMPQQGQAMPQQQTQMPQQNQAMPQQGQVMQQQQQARTQTLQQGQQLPQTGQAATSSSGTDVGQAYGSILPGGTMEEVNGGMPAPSSTPPSNLPADHPDVVASKSSALQDRLNEMKEV